MMIDFTEKELIEIEVAVQTCMRICKDRKEFHAANFFEAIYDKIELHLNEQ